MTRAYFSAALLLAACGGAAESEPAAEPAPVVETPHAFASVAPESAPVVAATPAPAAEPAPVPVPHAVPPVPTPAPPPVTPAPVAPPAPELTATGANCSTDAECADPAAVCLVDGDVAGTYGRPVCRLPRLELNERCPTDEGHPEQTGPVPPACEPGLWCRPRGSVLQCVEWTL